MIWQNEIYSLLSRRSVSPAYKYTFLWLLRHGNYTVLYDTLHVSHGTCHALPFNNGKITAGINFFNGRTPFPRRRLKSTWSWHVCYYTWYHIVYVVHTISPIISHTTIMIFRLLRHIEMHASTFMTKLHRAYNGIHIKFFCGGGKTRHDTSQDTTAEFWFFLSIL